MPGRPRSGADGAPWAAYRAEPVPDLHELVTHRVIAMVVRADAAQARLADQGSTAAALAAIAASGREVLAELLDLVAGLSGESVLDVLRPAGGPDRQAGAPGRQAGGPGRPAAVREPAGLRLVTGREREVLAQLGLGRSNPEIAAALGISRETVKTHVSRILMKLGLRDRVHAVVFAHRHGLVADPDAARVS